MCWICTPCQKQSFAPQAILIDADNNVRAPIFREKGSLDGTLECLAGLCDGLYNCVRVELFRAAAAGADQGVNSPDAR